MADDSSGDEWRVSRKLDVAKRKILISSDSEDEGSGTRLKRRRPMSSKITPVGPEPHASTSGVESDSDQTVLAVAANVQTNYQPQRAVTSDDSEDGFMKGNSDDDELLSLSSPEKGRFRYADVDSDETTFEGGSPPRVRNSNVFDFNTARTTLPQSQDPPAPVSPSNVNGNTMQRASPSQTLNQPRPLNSLKSPIVDYSSTDNEDEIPLPASIRQASTGESTSAYRGHSVLSQVQMPPPALINDGQLPTSSKTINGSSRPVPPSNFNDYSSTDDDSDSYPDYSSYRKKYKRRNRRGWYNSSDGEGFSSDSDIENADRRRKAYDPLSVTKENWHGDVQRTVTMLKDTVNEMPTPDEGGGDIDIKLPPGLVELYTHQKYAVQWMQWREGQFPGGGILADEMGLGKTIETIALIMKARWDCTRHSEEYKATYEEAGKLLPSQTTLIVCPLSCIPQWEREIEQKGKNLSVHIYHGKGKDISAFTLSRFDVIITTYQTIAYEIPKLPPPDSDIPPKPCRSPLKRLYWMRIVLDEAHQIRNPKTNAADAICQLEARHRWCVTGTPIHNRPEDFYSMVKFLRLAPFNERSVWDSWIGMKTVRRGGGGEQRLHVLGKALILRRTKEEVAQAGGKIKAIPPKQVDIVNVELNERERAIYDQLLGHARSILKEFLSQKEQRDHGLDVGGLIYAGNKLQEIRETIPGGVQYSHIFAMLTRLRQCTVLPYLITAMLTDEEMEEHAEDDKDMENMIDKTLSIFDRGYASSKVSKILEDVDELRAIAEKEGRPMDKVIIVSSWTTTLDILFEHLVKRKYTPVYICGRDDMSVRMQNQDRFNRNKKRPEILLLSLMAGGVGLNLTGANHVFFLEPHWNPQHEIQAQDRVHRFGQTKNVFIKRYIAEDTIETRIMELQQVKKDLADGLLNNTKKGKGAGITLEQMKRIFDL